MDLKKDLHLLMEERKKELDELREEIIESQAFFKLFPELSCPYGKGKVVFYKKHLCYEYEYEDENDSATFRTPLLELPMIERKKAHEAVRSFLIKFVEEKRILWDETPTGRTRKRMENELKKM